MVIEKHNVMKVLKSFKLNAFGGLNFVFERLNELGFDKLFESHLPALSPQSQYSWKDILYSLFSIYYTGGDAIEDINSVLREQLKDVPFFKISSSDTVLRRMAELAEDEMKCKTPRGKVEHRLSPNNQLMELSIEVLKKLGIFDSEKLVLDYDNTIISTEKSDSAFTYKKYPGYQPGVVTLNEKYLLSVENRSGNSDAKSCQVDTLKRTFEALTKQNPSQKIDYFRADGASYQYDVIKLVEKYVDKFYIGGREDYMGKYFNEIKEWKESKDTTGETIWLGETTFTPFQQRAKKEELKSYRLVVKRKANKNGQINIFTGDAFDYTVMFTNDLDSEIFKAKAFYNQRGNMERTFDVLKNDFGWAHLPFSKLSENTVFMYLSAIASNLYNMLIEHFSTIVEGLKPIFRIKKFIYNFIIMPAKWIRHRRQNYLKIYRQIQFKTQLE